MELCDGTLTHLVQQASATPQHRGLPPLDMVVLGICLCEGTLAVHEFAQALHLDIKPDNVLLTHARAQESSRDETSAVTPLQVGCKFTVYIV